MIGQKNGLVRQWARRGTRPRQPADQRYDNAYLFGAICPARGAGSALRRHRHDADAPRRNLAVFDSLVWMVDRGEHAAAPDRARNIFRSTAFAGASRKSLRRGSEATVFGACAGEGLAKDGLQIRFTAIVYNMKRCSRILAPA